jgi:FkbM family methyltransferase
LAYEQYKARLEVGDLSALRQWARSGSTVIDVGANVGFFTKRFAEWVGPNGCVIAIEPEEENFVRLNRMIDRRFSSDIVRTVQAVAAETNGTLKLALNPYHPADHKIDIEGISVAAVAIDDLVKRFAESPVSLIKIDVQGAEERVLGGALKTIQAFHPALFVEVDDQALRRMGSSARQLLQMLNDLGYKIRQLKEGKVSEEVASSQAVVMTQDGRYADFLFLHRTTNESQVVSLTDY